MDTITAEEANEWIRWLIADDGLPAQSPNTKEDVPWEQKQPLSWAEFTARLERYCNARRWEIILGEEDERSLLIYAPEEQPTDTADTLQGYSPFEEDALPF